MRADALLARRVAALCAAFERIARTRMAGLPIVHAGLRVEAIGFALEPDEAVAAGVLITPWFMNLVRLPIAVLDDAGVGAVRRRRLGRLAFDFVGGHEADVGGFEACSLYSPMFEFADMASAREVAQAVLADLRTEPRPARRSFLFGRGAAEAA